MSAEPIVSSFELGFPWPTFDPFLFCVHHNDSYPVGKEDMSPEASLAGRALGSDFGRKDGWSMYHGEVVPGFPRHPHRGFETVTLARRGFVDHSDSLGARARFGQGDAQWMTAGKGVVHSEMFPLLNRDATNPTELFQLWMNLPATDKMVEPHFAMLWSQDIPRVTHTDPRGQRTEIVTIAGALGGAAMPAPPPHSWASRLDSDVAIWTIKMMPLAEWTIPSALAGSNRSIYFFCGDSVQVGGRTLREHCGLRLRADAGVPLVNGDCETEILLLQGKPIGESVAHYGPFVMNSPAEIQQAISDYRLTEYGEWPWQNDAPVHSRDEGRFAEHASGKFERPGS